MDVGAILSRSLSVYRKNLNLILPHLIEYVMDLVILLIFGILAAIVLVSVLGSVTIANITSILYGPAPFLLITFAVFAIATLVSLSMFFNACARAAIIGMVTEAKKDGKTSLSTGLKSVKEHGLDIFGYTLAISVVPVFVIGAIMAVVFAAAFLTGGMNMAGMTLAIFLALLCLVGYVIIYVLALFSPQKMVIEGRGVVDGIRASFGFVREHPTGVVIYIGVAFAVAVMTSLVSMLFAVPGALFEYMGNFIAVFFRIIENIVSIALGLLVAPYLETVKTVMVLETGGEQENEIEKSVL